MNDELRAKIMEENTRMGSQALRVFAVAYKNHDGVPSVFDSESLEYDMTFIGLTGMIDPVRPEVKDAIVECRGAGIKPIMITGDHINTAKAIARELGILTDDSQAMMGADIDKYSDEEFEKIVENVCVYARVLGGVECRHYGFQSSCNAVCADHIFGFLNRLDKRAELILDLLSGVGSVLLNEDKIVLGLCEILGLDEQLLVELLTGAKTHLYDVDILVGLVAGEPDHIDGKVENLDRLAHIEHEELATLSHRACLHN